MRKQTNYKRAVQRYQNGGAVLDVAPNLDLKMDTTPPLDDASAAFAGQLSALRQAETLQQQQQGVKNFFMNNPDTIKNPYVLGAAEQEALKQGHQPHTDAFYADVKKRFEDKMIASVAASEPAPPPAPTKTKVLHSDDDVTVSGPMGASLYSAPVSREPPLSASGERPTKIRLSAEQKDMARRLGQSEVDYARGLIEMRERDREFGR